ncbi:MAG: alpha/beta hydrolase [Pseudomonadota bacterium]
MSLQATIAKLLLKLPAGLKVKMAGGSPVEIGGRTLDPNFQFIAHGAAKQPPMSSMTPQQARDASAAGLAMFADKPEPGVSWDDFELASRDGHQIPVRLYKPSGQNASAPMMTYFHFGGGVIGDLETCHVFCTMLASVVKCPVLSVEYRLAPEHKYPAALHDCEDAYLWVLENAEAHGAPSGRASVGGDSMGGHLSAVLSQQLREDGKPVPDLQLLIYPATNLFNEFESTKLYGETYPLSADTMEWFMGHFLGEDADLKDPLLSPALNPMLEGLPPAIIITAGFDPLVDQGAAYAKQLDAAGTDAQYKCYDSLAHGFTAFTAVVPDARTACLEVAGMVREAYTKRLEDA